MQKPLLSPHFGFDELTACPAHPELEAENRLEAAAFLMPLTALCLEMLEPVRAKFGPLIVTSGFRCPAVNAAIKGAAGSQHMLGQAADFRPQSARLDDVFNWIRAQGSLRGAETAWLRFGQVIREPGWIHLSLGEPWRDMVRCRQALVFDGQSYRLPEEAK